MTFRIREEKPNKTGSLPAHWDIFIEGSDESLITVWDSREMAEEIVRSLESYPERKKQNAEDFNHR